MRFKQLALSVLSLVMMAGSVLMACAPKATLATRVIDVAPDEALALIEENRDNPEFVVLDVRTPEEYAAGHIDGAVNINFALKDFRERLIEMKRDDTYLVYCRSGNRSAQAIDLMRNLRFEKIYHLSDGINEWQAAGLGLVR